MKAQQEASQALEEGIEELEEMELELARKLGFASVEEMEAMIDTEDDAPTPSFYDIVRPSPLRAAPEAPR